MVRGSRIVVPRTLQHKVVKVAHEGHQGITKTKEYLRTSVLSRARQNGGGAHPSLPPVPSGEHVMGERPVAHDTHAQ